MTTNESNHTCPQCSTSLEDGALSFGSGGRWHRDPPRGAERLFWVASASGEPVYGNMLSSPIVSSVPAARCPTCGTVVIWGADAA